MFSTAFGYAFDCCLLCHHLSGVKAVGMAMLERCSKDLDVDEDEGCHDGLIYSYLTLRVWFLGRRGTAKRFVVIVAAKPRSFIISIIANATIPMHSNEFQLVPCTVQSASHTGK